MTTFNHQSDGAVRCSDCLHCPVTNRGFVCPATGLHTRGRMYWRRCDQYQFGPVAQPAKPKPRVTCRSCLHRPSPAKNPFKPAGVYMGIFAIDKQRICDHWQPRVYRTRPEVVFVAKEHVQAAVQDHGANVLPFRPRSS